MPGASSAAPPVTSAADLEEFARWFAGIAAARDEPILEALSQPLEIDCALQPGQSLCADAAPGVPVHAYFMGQSGELGSPESFAFQLVSITARLARGAVSAGCASDASSCGRFVVAIDADPSRGPGSYIGFVFEVRDRVPVLRGVYPGGGDREIVLGGGESGTPWGTVAFAPLPP